jgi:hypothetical protein
MEYKIDRNLVVAMINCDFSGLTDKEIELVKNFNHDFTVTNWADDSSDINGRCDLTGLYSHCVTIDTKD